MTSPGPNLRATVHPPTHASAIRKSISNPAMSQPHHSRRLSERYPPAPPYLDHPHPYPNPPQTGGEYFIPPPPQKTPFTTRSALTQNLKNFHPRNDRTKRSIANLDDLNTQNLIITKKAQEVLNPDHQGHPNPLNQPQNRIRNSYTDRPQHRSPLKSQVFETS